MSVTPSLLRLGALLRDDLQMGAFSSIYVYFYRLAELIENSNRLVTACIAKTATGVQCLGFTFTVFGFLRSSPFSFVSYAATNRTTWCLERLA